MKNKIEKIRCRWVGDDERMQKYHDHVWGRPKKIDRDIFEAIVLDTFQAGLSWKCILHKRDNFARAFADFDPVVVSKFSDRQKARLMEDKGIIRNRLKIESAVSNAEAFLRTQKEYGAFAKYIWGFTGGKTIVNNWKTHKNVPSTTKISDEMSRDLKKRGFKFVGSTICYAFMQGIGIVNDHTHDCFIRKSIKSR